MKSTSPGSGRALAVALSIADAATIACSTGAVISHSQMRMGTAMLCVLDYARIALGTIESEEL